MYHFKTKLSSYVWIILADVYEQLYSWTFKFCKVMRQHIWGEVANFILSFSAVHLRMQTMVAKVITKRLRGCFLDSRCREHLIQRITFAAKTTAALRRAVATGRTDRHTHTHTQTPTTTIPSPPRLMRRAVDRWYKRLGGHTHSVTPSVTIPSLAKRRRRQ